MKNEINNSPTASSLLEDLKSTNAKVVANAIKRLSTIALALEK